MSGEDDWLEAAYEERTHLDEPPDEWLDEALFEED